MRRQRGALQVGQHAGDLFAPAGGHGSGQSALRAEEDRAGHQELRQVHVERRLWCAESGRGKIEQHRPVVDDDDVAQVEPAMRDASRVQAGDLLPQILERLVAHLLGVGELERLDVRLARDDECVTTGAEGGGHDFRHADSRLRRHQGGQRFVLDLLQPAGWSASRRILVRKKAPLSCEPLGVLSIATQHAHLQGMPLCVMADVLGGADVLLRRRPQVAHLDSK